MVLTIITYIILGIVQGITEWLPISSSGMTMLILSNFFNITSIDVLIKTSLFLHLGTFLAAIIYFRKDVKQLFKTIFNYKTSESDTKKLFNFILISTLISGIIGILIINFLLNFESFANLTGKTISLIIGILLFITGFLQLLSRKKGNRKIINLNSKDNIYLGIAQGLSSLPGLSRSGITVSILMLRKIENSSALKLSFLMSMPIILVGNILLNLKDTIISMNALYGLLFSFIFGLLTISGLVKISKKINFGWFILIFAILMIISILI